MNTLRWLFLILLSSVLMACQTAPEPDTPTRQLSQKKYVRGYLLARVRDRAGDNTSSAGLQAIYLPGFKVTLTDASSGTETGSVTTDLSGRFNFPAQLKGDYTLCWERDGYQSDCLPKPIQVDRRPVNVGDIEVQPVADYENTVVLYGKIGLRDEQDGRTLEPILTVNSFVEVSGADTHGTVFHTTPVNNFGHYLLPNVPRTEDIIAVTATAEQETMTRYTNKEALQNGLAHRLNVTLRNHVPRILDVIASMGGSDVETVPVGAQVDLKVTAVDADGDKLRYDWYIGQGEGTLSTTSSDSTRWQLPATKGRYRATVHVRDDHGGYATGNAVLAVGSQHASFSGRVVDIYGSPVSSANISIGATADTAVSNGDGFFMIKTALAKRYVLNIRKDGFGLVSKIYNRGLSGGRWTLNPASVFTVDPTKDIVLVDDSREKAGCYIPPTERVDWRTFKNVQYTRTQDATGKTTRISETGYRSPYPQGLIDQRRERQCGPGLEVKIPANTLVDKDGNSPPGAVQVTLSTVDLLAPDAMPGDYSVDDGTYMISYGAGSVDISAGGVDYHQLQGGTATLRIPVADIQLAAGTALPPTIPRLVYNETAGLWQREGDLTLDATGQFYEAQVDHFSTINADIQKSGQSCVRFKSEDMPLPYELDVLVPIPGDAPVQRNATISANDEYNLIINLPNNTDITLTAYTVDNNQVVPHGIFSVNTGGAQTGTPSAPNYSECQTKVLISPVEQPVPGADAFLHGLYSFNATKVAEIEPGGTVTVPDQQLKDDLEDATIAYYNTIDPRGRRNTFAKFKQVNGFVADGNTPLQNNYGPVAEVRAAYANAVDLGFGRDMHGKRELADDGEYDIAFYVTNYGDYASDDEGDFEQAVGQNPDNVVATVAMEWSRIEDGPATDYDYYDPDNVDPDPNPPGAPLVFSDNERVIKFYVYNKQGDPVFAADLDGRGVRPIPQLCMVCHGGAYAGGFNTGIPAFSQPADVKLGAVMLPFDIHGYVLTGAVPADFSKANQQLELHELNKMVVDTEPGAAIDEIIDEMYSPANPAGADVQLEDFVVSGWNANNAHEDMYLNVVKPACRVCHASRPLEDNGGGGLRDIRLNDVQPFLLTPANGGIAAAASTRVCVQRVMPHALATYNRFWHSYNPLSPLEGTLYQPSRLQAFFDGVVEPVLGGNLGAGCVTPADPDDSVIEEPVTLTLLQSEVFDACAGCHTGGGNATTFPYVDLNLSAGATHGSTVNVDAQESSTTPKLKRVLPNQPAQSFLYKKIEGSVGAGDCNTVPGASGCTDAMPPPGGGLSQDNIDDVAEWINDGAQDN